MEVIPTIKRNGHIYSEGFLFLNSLAFYSGQKTPGHKTLKLKRETPGPGEFFRPVLHDKTAPKFISQLKSNSFYSTYFTSKNIFNKGVPLSY